MTDIPPPPLAPPDAPPMTPGGHAAPAVPLGYAAPPPGAAVAYPGAQPMPPGYYVAVRRPTNVLAIVGFVLSLVGLWFLPIIGSIAAIVLAFQARKQILTTQEDGGGLATAALIIGWIGLGLWAFGLLAYFAFLFFVIGIAATSPY